MKVMMTVVILLVFSESLFAQTLTTAETLGKEKKSFFVAESALVVKNFTTLNYVYAQYLYGISDRFDLYVGPGVVTGFGRSQVNVAVGGNLNLLKSKAASVSLFNILSTGLNKRSESAIGLLFSAVVVSHSFKSGRAIYSGYSVLSPWGRTRDKLFTPPEPLHNIPAGVMIPLGTRALIVEYDYGRKLQMVAVGWAFPP